MNWTHVHLEQNDAVGILWLDHPPANALSQPTFSGLNKALDYVEEDASLKVIVIAGKGRFFAAGADIREFTAVTERSQGSHIARVGQVVFQRMDTFSKPIIAAIHGAALGGGLELAMACHLRYCTPTTKLGLPELNLGLIPGFAGTQRLPRLVGKAKALELLFTSKPVQGEEALQLGLVNGLFAEEELIARTVEIAKEIAQKSAVSLAYVLEAVSYGEQHGLQEGAKKEAELFGRIFESEDAKEGIQAFMEKRKPQFKDR